MERQKGIVMDEQMIAQAVKNVIKALDAGQETTYPACKESHQKMTLKLAKQLIEKIELRAGQMGMAVVIAVADQSARPVAVHCMDHAYLASFDVALNKTFTSAGLKMSTEALGKLSQPGQPLYGIQHTNQGKIVIFGGGEPLMIEDELIGAVGVSGGTAEQDTALALYAKEVFKEVVSCL